MTEIVQVAVDRAGWDAGPWDNEPDRIEWYVGDTPCLILRNPHFGNLCGYVAVPPGHQWHGRVYDNIDEEAHADVHGGLTYSDFCFPQGGICHVPRPGQPDNVWWLGFDCNHCGDHAPAMSVLERKLDLSISSRTQRQYRDVSYVTERCEALARRIQMA